MRCKLVQNHRQPRTSFEATRWQSWLRKHFFLRGQPYRKLRDRQLGYSTFEEQIGKHIYKLKLQATVRLLPVVHVNNICPYFTASLRFDVPLTSPKGDDDEFEVYHISNVCIKSLSWQRGKYLLFTTHFIDDDIPHISHRFNKVRRTTAL
jgi:hypothetical protein